MRLILCVLFLFYYGIIKITAQNKFDCLIYSMNQGCGFEDLISIDTTCLTLSSSLSFSPDEFEFYTKQLDIRVEEVDTSNTNYLNIRFVEWKDKGNRLIYYSENSLDVISKYHELLTLMTDLFGVVDRLEITYTLQDTTAVGCKVTRCNQSIGLGFEWSFKSGYESISVYLTTEFDHLTLYVDNLKWFDDNLK